MSSKRVLLTMVFALSAHGASAVPCVTNALDGAELLSTLISSGWGIDVQNTRYQPPQKAGVGKADLGEVALLWSYGVERAREVRSQPVVTGRALFMGTRNGTVLALDRETGCEYWTFHARAEVRTALSMGPSNDGARALLYFGDFRARIYAVDASSGELVWEQEATNFFAATSTGAPTLHNGRLYVPVSSLEVGVAILPFYPCCWFQGKVVAMDAQTGAILWSRSVIDERPRAIRSDDSRIRFGPAGAPVWSAPTLDAKRNRLYVGTGQGYVRPVPARSDAIVALDLDSGEILWARQMLDDDAWNVACVVGGRNCPSPQPGPDFDFGAPPVLATLEDGGDRIYAGQKSGDVYALDPDRDGDVVWHRKVGLGGALGGVHFGLATDGRRLYVPISDAQFRSPREPGPGAPEPRPGIFALDLRTGETLWEARPVVPCRSGRDCVPAFSAAVMVSDGYVLAADLEGNLWGLDSETGAVLWSVSTLGQYESVNGIPGRGGSIDSSGPLVAGGGIYVGSGYGLFGRIRGNAFLTFRVP